LFNTRLTGTDVLVTELVDLNTDDVFLEAPINARFGDTDSALFDSDTLVMPVFLEDLGITAGHSRINYGIPSFGSFMADPVDNIGFQNFPDDFPQLDKTLSADTLKPGVTATGTFDGFESPLLWADMPGTSLNIRRDASAYAADHGMGAMMVHF